MGRRRARAHPRLRCKPGAGRVRGAATRNSRLPAGSIPSPAPVPAVPAPCGSGERPGRRAQLRRRQGCWRPSRLCPSCAGAAQARVRCAAPARPAGAWRSGSRRATAGPCLRWPGGRRCRPAGCRRPAPRAGAVRLRVRSASVPSAHGRPLPIAGWSVVWRGWATCCGAVYASGFVAVQWRPAATRAPLRYTSRFRLSPPCCSLQKAPCP